MFLAIKQGKVGNTIGIAMPSLLLGLKQKLYFPLRFSLIKFEITN